MYIRFTCVCMCIIGSRRLLNHLATEERVNFFVNESSSLCQVLNFDSSTRSEAIKEFIVIFEASKELPDLV